MAMCQPTAMVQWKHLQPTLARDIFPVRQCACNSTCDGDSARIKPPLADSAATGSTPCFDEGANLDELLNGQEKPFSYAKTHLAVYAYASTCFQKPDPVFDVHTSNVTVGCFTPGHPYSLAPSRGEGNPSRVLFLTGDSRSGALVPGFASALAGEDMSFAFAAVGGGGGFFDLWPQDAPVNCSVCEKLNDKREWTNASTWSRNARVAIVRQLQSGDVLAVMNTDYKFPASEYIDAQRAFLAQLADEVAGKGGTLLLVGDTPTLPLTAERCYLDDDVSR